MQLLNLLLLEQPVLVFEAHFLLFGHAILRSLQLLSHPLFGGTGSSAGLVQVQLVSPCQHNAMNISIYFQAIERKKLRATMINSHLYHVSFPAGESKPTYSTPDLIATPGTSPCHSACRQGAHSTGKLAFFCHFLNKKTSKNSKVRQLPADMAGMADFSAGPGRQHGITAEIIRPSQSQQVCVMILMVRSVRFG